MTDRDELQRRYDDLRDAPWMEAAQPAIQEIRPLSAIRAKGLKALVLDALPLAAADQARQPTLSYALRPHWEKKIEAPEVPLRQSFDEAMTHLQMMELAIETGYLTVDAVRDDVRSMMFSLLWSKGARRFVQAYEYVAVRALAARVGVDLGLPKVQLPPVDPAAQVRFATFLSHYETFWRCPETKAWCDFLDDYRRIEDETAKFLRFVRAEEDFPEPVTEHFARLARGMYKFITMLVGLFGMLQRNEIPHFGLIHSYWLARFHGCRLGSDGRYYQYGRSWADMAPSFDVLLRYFGGADADASNRLSSDLAVLASAWNDVRAVVEAHTIVASPGATPSTSPPSPSPAPHS